MTNLILTHETHGRQHRLVAACFQHGWRSMQYNPELDREANHLAVARKLADALGGSVHYGEHGLSDEGGIFHMAGQRNVVVCNSDIPPERNTPHVNAPGSLMNLRDKASDCVAQVLAFRDAYYIDIYHGDDTATKIDAAYISTAAEAETFVRAAFAARQRDLTSPGLADEPDDTDDTSAVEPATGRQEPATRRQDAAVVLVAETPVNAASRAVVPVHVVNVTDGTAGNHFGLSASATVNHTRVARSIPWNTELSELENHLAVANVLAAAYGGQAIGEIGNVSFSLPIIRKVRHGVHTMTLKLKSPPRHSSRLGARCTVGAGQQAALWREWKSAQLGRELTDDEIPAWAKPCTRADLFMLALQSGKTLDECLAFGNGGFEESEAAMPALEWEAHKALQQLEWDARDREYAKARRVADMKRDVAAGEMRDESGWEDQGRASVLAILADQEASVAAIPPHMGEAMRRVYGPKWVMARRTPGNLLRYDGYAFVTKRQYEDVARVWQALQANQWREAA